METSKDQRAPEGGAKSKQPSGNVEDKVRSAMEDFISNPGEVKWDDLVRQMRTDIKKDMKRNSAAASSSVSSSPLSSSRTTVEASPDDYIDNSNGGDGGGYKNGTARKVDDLVAAALSAIPAAVEEQHYPPGKVAATSGAFSREGLDAEGLTPERKRSNLVGGDDEEWGDGTRSDISGGGGGGGGGGEETGATGIDFFPGKDLEWSSKAKSAYEAQTKFEKDNTTSLDDVAEPLDPDRGGSSPGSGPCPRTAVWLDKLILVSSILFLVVLVPVAILGRRRDDASSELSATGPEAEAGSAAADDGGGFIDLSALSAYGYPNAEHTWSGGWLSSPKDQQVTTAGWIAWPRESSDGNFRSFDDSDGVTSLEECAKTCREIDAPTGAWDVKFGACWCTHRQNSQLCKEPCVELEFVDFSITPLSTFDYCPESACHDDWMGSDSCLVHDVKYHKMDCEAKINTLLGNGNENLPHDLSLYGYPYSLTTSGTGWISWPQDLNDVNFKSFDASDGVTSVETCAAKCQEINASTGAWDVVYEACWCTYMGRHLLCKEPCVEEQYVDFSKHPITVSDAIRWCGRSVCHEDWFHSDSYCTNRVKFDEDKCDATIMTVMAAQGVPASFDGSVSYKAALLIKQNLSRFGYPYVQTVEASAGWLSGPWNSEDGDYSKFDAENDVTSVEECTAKCLEVNARTGAWDIEYGRCWCTSMATTYMCKEPCVEGKYVDFSVVPFTEFDFCERSVCDADWLGSDSCFVRGVLYDKDLCVMKTEALLAGHTAVAKPAEGFENIDLSMYGYAYAQHTTSVGWVSWPQEVHNNSLLSFEAVASVEECAANCRNATIASSYPPVGAWDANYRACFCSFVDVEHLCKEPCVEEEYVEFAVVPFSQFDFCGESVCGEDWLHSDEYCVDLINFDKDACDAKIKALASSSSPPDAISPTTPGIADEDAAKSTVQLDPSAMATVKISSPDAKNEGLINFSVENGNDRISFIRFSLSAIPEGKVIESVTLHLYLIRSISDDEEDIFEVAVYALPESSEDWSSNSISYNEALDSEGEFLVNSFEVTPLDRAVLNQMYMVDVTSAIDMSQTDITFKLSTESDVRLDFAGEQWNDGKLSPSLWVTMSEPTDAPTANPSKKPSLNPTKEPTKSPTAISYENIDLATYGFLYTIYTNSVGWVSWPQHYEEENFESFDEDDGITSIGQCASKCQEVNANIGAWDVADGACWCSSMDVELLCKEPCVEAEYAQFSTAPLALLDYCEKSVCDADWHHSPEYCLDKVDFDKDACDSKIISLASTSSVSTSPTASATNPKHAGSVRLEMDIVASAMATTKLSSPDAKDEGLINFSVENGNERLSFMRFYLPEIQESDVVESAFLHLYLTRSISDDEEDAFEVSVHVLPQSPEKWSSGSVSYNEPLDSYGDFLVNSFEVVPLDNTIAKLLYTVNVTSAIDPSRKDITFKISTDSDVRLDFAGEKWNDGEALPWLRVELSRPTSP